MISQIWHIEIRLNLRRLSIRLIVILLYRQFQENRIVGSRAICLGTTTANHKFGDIFLLLGIRRGEKVFQMLMGGCLGRDTISTVPCTFVNADFDVYHGKYFKLRFTNMYFNSTCYTLLTLFAHAKRALRPDGVKRGCNVYQNSTYYLHDYLKGALKSQN